MITATELCVCQHPTRRHGPDGCGVGECWCDIEGASPEAPRRPEPRPAGDALVLPPAAVGGDDADEGVAADPVATSVPATSIETAAVVAPDTAAALDDIAALVERVLDHAMFFTVRWYCPSCIAWPLDPGDCRTCKSALQPVYLATLPREVTP